MKANSRALNEDAQPGRAETHSVEEPAHWRPAVKVDQTDLLILRALENDGRLSKSDLAAHIGLSVSACIERLRRLEKKKLILNYRAEINLRLLSRFEIFFTEVTLNRHRSLDFFNFERYVSANEKIVECYALGGGVDYLIKVVAAGASDYQGFIDEFLEANLGVDRYFTYIVTKSIKTRCLTPISALNIRSE